MRWLSAKLERSFSLEEGDKSQKGDGEAREEASEKATGSHFWAMHAGKKKNSSGQFSLFR